MNVLPILIPQAVCRRHEVGLVTIVSLLRIGRINRWFGLWLGGPVDAPCPTSSGDVP
jgi:hypothetical protein